jgi:ribokinase
MDLVIQAPRHPRPGETVLGSTFRTLPGGKGANQAIAAARLGAETVLVAMLGEDAFGDSLAAFLQDETVDTTHVGRTQDATGVGCIVIDSDAQNAIVVVPGANARLAPEDVRRVEVSPGDVLVSQLEIPLATVAAFFAHGRECGAITFLNLSPALACPPRLLDSTDVVVLNETEASEVAG